MCLTQSNFGLGTALADIGNRKEGLQAARRIFRAVDNGKVSPIDGLSTKGILPSQPSSGRIEFRNVYFSYPTRPGVNVCKDYSITIEPGEVVALVGPSGSGKSTIMNLLLRFYDADAGEIFFDGVNVKDLNVRYLRSQIGYVGQEPVLFSGSVRENILKGKASIEVEVPDEQPNATFHNDIEAGRLKRVSFLPLISANANTAQCRGEDEVIQAAITSNAHEFISGTHSTFIFPMFSYHLQYTNIYGRRVPSEVRH